MLSIYLYFRVLLGIIFFTSFVSHLFNMEKYISDIKAYNIFPENSTKTLGVFIILLEFCVGVLLILGYYQKFSLVFSTLLLLLFTGGITINLMRNNKINCACGGILGDSQISWKLILRNIFFLLIVLFLSIYSSLNIDVFSMFFDKSINPLDILTLFLVVPSILLSLTLINIINIKNILLNFSKE